MTAAAARGVSAVPAPPLPDPLPGPGEDDSGLVAAARRGDRGALARLHARYAPVVHGLLLARLAPADADDLVQDVFLRVMGRLASLRDDRAFPGWISAMARNRANSFFRDRGRAARHEAVVARIGPSGDAVAQKAPPAPDPAAAALARLSATEVLDVIRALPEAYSETLVLRLVEGLSGPQIAARTGMTHGSVRVNLHRGMTMLKERLSGGVP